MIPISGNRVLAARVVGLHDLGFSVQIYDELRGVMILRTGAGTPVVVLDHDFPPSIRAVTVSVMAIYATSSTW